MKVKKICGFIFLTLFSVSVNGQIRQPHSLYFMNTIPQVSQMNPAFQPRANGYVMLPNVSIDVISDLTVKDVFQKHGDKWYTPIEKEYDYPTLYKSIGKEVAMINVGADIGIIGFGFRIGNGYFSFGISEHSTINTALPRDLFKITENGFPDGTSLDFSPLCVQAMSYMQLLIGYSSKVNDRLSIGMNMKPLFGQAAVATDIRKFKLYTGEEQWDLDAEGSIYSSSPSIVTTDAEGKIDKWKVRDVSEEYKTKDWIHNYGTDLNNLGVAFDFGAVYQIDKRFTVSASLNNLGFISWKQDLNGTSFNGKYNFKGLEYDTSKDNDDLFKKLGDSIADVMNYKVQHDRFKTALAPVFHVGATYQLSKSMSAGLLSRSIFLREGIRQSFNASFNLQPYSFFALNANTTYEVKGNVYLGGGFTLFPLLPLQIYVLVDYIPVYYSTLEINGKTLSLKIFGKERPIPIPERQKSVTVRAGLNIIFGKHGNKNKPMLDNVRSSWN